LYYYFKNKEEIFVAVVRAETRAFINDLQAKAAAFPDIRRHIRFYLTERIRRYGEVLHLTRLSVDIFHKLAPLFDEVYQETRTGEIAYLTGLLRNAAQYNAILINEPSAILAERLFHLSDALKHNAVRGTGGIHTQIDFTPALDEMEFWTKMVLR